MKSEIIKLFEDFGYGDIQVEKIKRIGGLTNKNYYIKSSLNEYVVRFAGENTSNYINRLAEKYNSSIVSQKGIYPNDIFFNETSGDKISLYIQNSKNFSELNGIEKLDSIGKIAEIFYETHSIEDPFYSNFNYFDELEKYIILCESNKVEYFGYFKKYKNYIMSTKEKYEKYQKYAVPCHIDPLGENFLIANDSLYLIDWEYSAMHDKYWDIAAFCLENNLSDIEEHRLISRYSNFNLDTFDMDRYNLYKIYQDFLWHLWGLYKASLGEDFYLYSKERFERGLNNLKLIGIEV